MMNSLPHIYRVVYKDFLAFREGILGVNGGKKNDTDNHIVIGDGTVFKTAN